ncbi:Nitroreductase [Nakamurella panacisegetis]|uniref:Nitroreductase n=1 Tax=Nakamurella panacisegetis TaxID=1090615 RepID=A0A1H0S8U0_9ACTN|nr:nitroreductase family protein [Nakamurella panacisegetis]SDP38170.1 Nitroreductase [Nakamurella panacisegetis]
MTTLLRPVGNLTDGEVESVLQAAIAAPSLHNSQPWLFRCTDRTIELRADPERMLPASDPDRRETLLACGAALLNLRIAIGALGSAVDLRLLPDPADRDLLAILRPEGFARVTPHDQRLARAIRQRHTSRRPFLDEPVPPELCAEMRRAARTEQSWLATVAPAQQSRLRDILAEAHRVQQQDPQFRAEFEAWTARTGDSSDGVPLRSAGIRPAPQDVWTMRDFGTGSAPERRPGKEFESDPLVAVIGSFHDLPLAQLNAGQAMQRVLLTATAGGLASSFMSQVIEVPSARAELRGLLGGALWPQTVLRLGYGSPAPPTPRRRLDEVLSVD